MSETLLANIFFIITGSAILVVGAFLCVAVYHVIRVVKLAHTILERVQSSTELIVEDIQALREQLMSGSFMGRVVGAFMLAMGSGKSRRAASRKKKDITSEE